MSAAQGSKIIEAYSFVCHNYRSPNDKIILIGYSRGAFVMRCVADLIQKAGLLTKKGLYRLPIVFKEWLAGHESPLLSRWIPDPQPTMVHRNWFYPIIRRPTPPGRREAPLEPTPEADRTILQALKEEDSLVEGVQVTALALWDTVSSIATPLPARAGQPTSTSLTFVGSDLRGVNYAFQALALHESRWNFPPIVLRRSRNVHLETAEVHLEQCWFAGYHADVGGSKKDNALGHLALAWIFGKLRDNDLLDFDESLFWMPRSNVSSFKIDTSTNRGKYIYSPIG
jgi:hypothetical protein